MLVLLKQLAFDLTETTNSLEEKEAKIQELTSQLRSKEEELEQKEQATSAAHESTGTLESQVLTLTQEKTLLEAEVTSLKSGSAKVSQMDDLLQVSLPRPPFLTPEDNCFVVVVVSPKNRSSRSWPSQSRSSRPPIKPFSQAMILTCKTWRDSETRWPKMRRSCLPFGRA